MIATDILLTFWKRKDIIALFVAIAMLACHGFLLMKQSYTASVYIKYTENLAADGQATDGSDLDPYEITDTYIVGKALNQLGMTKENVTAYAHMIKVIPVISNAEQEKYDSWINEFSDYNKTEDKKPTPVYYRIEFRSNEGIQFAKNFLTALVHQYRCYYTERYTGFSEVALLPESLVLDSDYYTSLELIREEVRSTVEYLNFITDEDLDYRSPVTGYSLKDLVDAYGLMIETDFAPVMQYVLDTGVSKDISNLIAQLHQNADMAQLESDEEAKKASTQKELMDLYSDKNQEYVFSVVDLENYISQVYGDVERDRIYNRNMTTYDQMILDYVEFAVKSGDLLIDKAHINENLKKFTTVSPSAQAQDGKIAAIYDRYASLTKITGETLSDYNMFKCGRVVMQASGIRVTEALPELLYFTVSGILAVGLSCGLLVVCEFMKSKENDEAE